MSTSTTAQSLTPQACFEEAADILRQATVDVMQLELAREWRLLGDAVQRPST